MAFALTGVYSAPSHVLAADSPQTAATTAVVEADEAEVGGGETDENGVVEGGISKGDLDDATETLKQGKPGKWNG